MKPRKSQLYSFRTAVASILEDFLFLNIEGIIVLIFSSILLYSCHCDGFTGILNFHLLVE